MAYDSYIVQEEDGTSHLVLEENTGDIITEEAVLLVAPALIVQTSGARW